MASFICKVLTPQGQIVKIKMNGNDKISCLKKLKQNGMTPISIKSSFNILKNDEKTSAKIYSSRRKSKNKIRNQIIQLSDKVTIEEIRIFTNNFYILKKAKFTNHHALKTIMNSTKNLQLKKVLNIMLKNLESGKLIYKTMEEYKNIFPYEYIYLIKTGELTGKLEASLEHAIRYLEDEEEIKRRIQKTLIPNIIMFFGVIIMTILSILIGVPLLKNIFLINESNIRFPKILLILSFIMEKVIKYWYIIIALVAFVVFSIIRYKNTTNGRYKIDKFIATNILFGKISFLLDFSRLLGSVLINLKNKMRVQDALDISKNVIKNTYMLDIIDRAINNIYVGKSWIEPFENEKILSPIVIEMLKKGDTGNLAELMEKVEQYIDFEIENEIDKLLRILPEISYTIVGIAILIFIITIVMPIMQVYLGGFLFR